MPIGRRRLAHGGPSRAPAPQHEAHPRNAPTSTPALPGTPATPFGGSGTISAMRGESAQRSFGGQRDGPRGESRRNHSRRLLWACLLSGIEVVGCTPDPQRRRASVEVATIAQAPRHRGRVAHDQSPRDSRPREVIDAGAPSAPSLLDFLNPATPDSNHLSHEMPPASCRQFLTNCHEPLGSSDFCTISQTAPDASLPPSTLPWPAYQLVAWRVRVGRGFTRPDAEGWSRRSREFLAEGHVRAELLGSPCAASSMFDSLAGLLLDASDLDTRYALDSELAAQCAARSGDERCAVQFNSAASALRTRAATRFVFARERIVDVLEHWHERYEHCQPPFQREVLISFLIHLSARLGDLPTCQARFDQLAREFPQSGLLRLVRIDLAVAHLLAGEHQTAGRLFLDSLRYGSREDALVRVLSHFVDGHLLSPHERDAVLARTASDVTDLQPLLTCAESPRRAPRR